MSKYLFLEAKIYIYQCRGFHPYPNTLRKLAHMNLIEQWRQRLIRMIRKTVDFHRCVFYQDLFNRLPCYLNQQQTYHLIAAKKYVDQYRKKERVINK